MIIIIMIIIIITNIDKCLSNFTKSDHSASVSHIQIFLELDQNALERFASCTHSTVLYVCMYVFECL